MTTGPTAEEFRLVRSRKVYPHRPIPIREDLVETPFGQVKYTVLEYHDAYAGVALTKEGKIILVKVVRHPIGLGYKLWELPGGRLDPGETPEQCVRRELEEETGYVAEHVTPLLPPFYPEPSHSTEKLGLYLMWGLTHTGRQVEESEGLPEVGVFSLDEALQMVLSGAIRSSWSVIGVLAAKVSLLEHGKVVPLE